LVSARQQAGAEGLAFRRVEEVDPLERHPQIQHVAGSDTVGSVDDCHEVVLAYSDVQ